MGEVSTAGGGDKLAGGCGRLGGGRFAGGGGRFAGGGGSKFAGGGGKFAGGGGKFAGGGGKFAGGGGKFAGGGGSDVVDVAVFLSFNKVDDDNFFKKSLDALNEFDCLFNLDILFFFIIDGVVDEVDGGSMDKASHLSVLPPSSSLFFEGRFTLTFDVSINVPFFKKIK